MFQLEWE
ncbi:hypothetical protein EYF80_064599 [Liparis tanakae]|nr:hypothetical protein EYF80_064599 [Liparis tanakae]